MTGSVSFYLIAILAQPVKIHSLQERNVDRHVKKKNVYITIIHLKWSCPTSSPGRFSLALGAGPEVNIWPLFTEIEKNNCFSIYTGSDPNKIRDETIKKYDLIDRSNHA